MAPKSDGPRYRRIQRVGLQNFLGYGRYSENEVGLLNIFVGKNSSGKSTILHALALLSETLVDPSTDTSLLFSGNGIDLGVYQDVVFKGKRSQSIRLELEFEPEAKQRKFSERVRLGAESRPNTLGLTYREDPTSSRPYLSALTVHAPAGRCFTLQGGRGSRSVGYHGGSAAAFASKPKTVLPRFKHFLPSFEIDPAATLRGIAPFLALNEWSESVRDTLADVVYIGPSRAPLSVLYLATGAYPQKLDSTASNLVQLLARATRRKRDRARVANILNHWLGEKFGLVNGAQVASFLEGHAFRLTGVDPIIRAGVALSNTGYGVSQVLPLVALLALGQPGIVLVEQPELHLHPDAQAELADLLLEFCRRGYQLFVETHSEHLLLRLRALFARKQTRLSASDVGIFFVEKKKSGSRVTRVSVEETGRLERWPAGFFGASAEDIGDLLRSGAYE